MRSGLDLNRRYRLEEIVGRGGMGEVWRARDLLLGRPVAVKILPSEFGSEMRRQAWFRREAMVSASLQHPGIAVVHDVGEHDGTLFFVMEYLAGEDLASVLRRSRGGLPVERILSIATQLADALATAHQHGVVHRDIKPENIMVLPSGQLKICDFGLARVIKGSVKTATAGIGTAAYMAPEQFDGRVDQRSDLYSFGCVLYELSTGDRPFVGTDVQLMYKHREEAPVAPYSVRTDLPVEMNDLVMNLLEKQKEDRPQTARQVLERVRHIRRSVEEPAARVIVALSRPQRPNADSGDRIDEDRKRCELPPLALLGSGSPVRNWSRANEAIRNGIQEALARAGMAARVGRLARGPMTSRYEVRLEPTADPDAVLRLAGSISNVLGGVDVRPIRSMKSSSPLPGIAAVGFEITNADQDLVSLGDILRSDVESLDGSHPKIGLGRGFEGSTLVELQSLPHLLIAGMPGAGTSVAIRSIVASLLMQAAPNELRMVLVDSKKAGLMPFDGLQHLVSPVITDPIGGIAILRWVEQEMDRRYDDLQASDCRTVDDYNEAVREGRLPRPIERLGGSCLPHPPLVVVIHELAELTTVRRSQTDALLGRLARLARAVGIHLIAATREATSHVLTERVRAGVMSRLAVRTSDAEGSELLLDEPGAERLLGAGDALLLAKGYDRPRRLRCAYVSDGELASVVDYWMQQG